MFHSTNVHSIKVYKLETGTGTLKDEIINETLQKKYMHVS